MKAVPLAHMHNWSTMIDNSKPEIETVFREPTNEERSLFERLLEAEFPGREQLAPLL